MNIKEIKNNIKQIDKKIVNIVKNGVKFSFVFCIIATLILVTYTITGGLNQYYIGISLLKTSLFFIVGFLICGIAFNNIIKEIN